MESSAASVVAERSKLAPINAAEHGPSRAQLVERASLLLPLMGFGIGAWLLLRGGTRSAGLATLGSALGAGFARWQLARLFSEQAHYDVEQSDGSFEVRLYAPRVQAETVLSAAAWRDSLEQGFDRLAGYIFGKNAAHSKIAMTAPVTLTVGASDRAVRSMTFKMPDDRALETLPEPDDRGIALRRIPSRRVAALQFRGRYGVELPDKKRTELLSRVRGVGLMPIGDVVFAGYDPPPTRPWLRRTDVLVEVSTLRPEATP